MWLTTTLPLISFTGSTRWGGASVRSRRRAPGPQHAGTGWQQRDHRLGEGRPDLALASAFFGAVGTAGQRCTTTRRLIVQEKVYDALLQKLISNYKRVRIGDPLDPATLMGPLIDEGAVADFEKAIEAAKKQGGKVLYGGKVLKPFPWRPSCSRRSSS
jgi:acyl-CoA reductase-like NAD-dependent aldehyde dehydrogenase